jgi:tyrosyl-tRNA synthetase
VTCVTTRSGSSRCGLLNLIGSEKPHLEGYFLFPTMLVVNTRTNQTELGHQSGQTHPEDFIDELVWRGIYHQCSDLEGLREHLAAGTRKAYIGLDPTADSLTIGNLATLKLLAHFQRAGHHPVVIAGGGTGLIGDPGGKSAERPLLSIEQVRANVVSQMRIYAALFGPEVPVLNNADWLTELGWITVLRDIGKHFSVNEMVKRDTVRNRLDGDGISYTEFSYMLLQSYDFAHLFQSMGVTLQMGGSDQWGNIVSGVDLIRRLHGGQSFALTGTLVVKADGTKFGKSETGAIWLTADRTSPYAFHQFWLNTDDNDVVGYLKRFTFLTRDEIASLEQEVATNPGGRAAQRKLADEVTTWLHGADACARANAAARALFSGDVRELDAATVAEVFSDVPSSTWSISELSAQAVDAVTVLVTTGLATSNRQAREFLSAGSVLVNGSKIDADASFGVADLMFGDTLLVRRGKKNWHLARWS